VINLSEDIRSLSDFKRHTNELLTRMRASGHPMVLTVNGKAKLVVQDAVSYQKILDTLDRAEAIAGIRKGLADIKRGRTSPGRQAFDQIRKKHGIPVKAKA